MHKDRRRRKIELIIYSFGLAAFNKILLFPVSSSFNLAAVCFSYKITNSINLILITGLDVNLSIYSNGSQRLYLGAILQINCTASDFFQNTTGGALLIEGELLGLHPTAGCLFEEEKNWTAFDALKDVGYSPPIDVEYCKAANQTTGITISLSKVISENFVGKNLTCVAFDGDYNKDGQRFIETSYTIGNTTRE